MILKLQERIVALLRTGLAGAVPNPVALHIVTGPPPANPRPFLAVYGGDLHMGAQAPDFSSSQPRPMELKEEFPVQAGTPQGPYSLAQTPLKGSALGRLVYDKGGLDERRRLIQENKDFTIDYPNASLQIQADMADASHVQLVYFFAGIFFVQEFRQEFFLEVLGPDVSALERLSSLAASVIFTNHDELIAHYNQSNRTVYSATQYLSEHWIGRLAWLDNSTVHAGNNSSVKMRFSVNGQVKHIRADAGGFGIIESIRSPGQPATTGVNISPEMG